MERRRVLGPYDRRSSSLAPRHTREVAVSRAPGSRLGDDAHRMGDHDQPDRTQASRRVTVRQSIRHRMTVREAADDLGITVEAVRNRIKRGTLSSEKEGGSVFVLLDREQERGTDQTAGQSGAGRDQPAAGRRGPQEHSRDQPQPDDRPAELVEELRDRIAYLERQVEEEREARRRADTLMARLMDRVPELPAASQEEPRESPGTAAGDQTRPPDTTTGRPSPQTGKQLPWWRRVFGR